MYQFNSNLIHNCNNLNLYNCYFVGLKTNTPLFFIPSTGHLHDCYLNDKNICSDCNQFDESKFELQDVSIEIKCPNRINNCTRKCKCENIFNMLYCFITVITMS